MTKHKIIAVSGIMLSLTILLGFFLVSTGVGRSNDPPGNKVGSTQTLTDFQVIQVGSNSLMSEVVSGLASRGAQVDQISDIPPPRAFDNRTAVVIDDRWLTSRVSNPELHTFLKLAASGGARLVVIGDDTSELYVALDRAEVKKLLVTDHGVVRNPAHNNPPLVGFKFQTRNGHFYPYHLANHSNDPADLIEGLANWLPED